MTDFGYSTEDGPCCAGCNGGDYDASFAWLNATGNNLIQANDWKYQPLETTCDYDSKDHTRVQIESWTDVP